MSTRSTMASSRILGTDLPDPTKDGAGWNSIWEQRLRLADPVLVPAFEDVLMSQYSDLHHLLSDLQANIATLRTCQLHLTALANAAFKQGFEAKWRDAPSAERRKHLVEGFVRCWIDNPAGESDRMYCADVLVDNLDSEKGAGFIRLLRAYLVEDLSTKAADAPPPKMYPSPVWYYKVEQAKKKGKDSKRIAMWDWLQANRDLYLCRFVIFTLTSWAGGPRPEAVVANTKPVKVNPENNKQPSDDSVKRCNKCQKAEDPDADGKKFMRCSKCYNNVERSVWYCSTTCQTEDWKAHKKFCGKPYTLEKASKTPSAGVEGSTTDLSELEDKIPPADPSFTRSPALQNQIHLLSKPRGAKSPAPDYILHSSKKTTYEVHIREVVIKMAFIESRNEAFRTGHAKNVTYIAQYLVRYVSKNANAGISSSDVIKQLSAEFPLILVGVGIEKLDRIMAQDPTTNRGRSAIEVEADTVDQTVQNSLRNTKSAEKTRQILREQWGRDETMQRILRMPKTDDPKIETMRSVMEDIFGEGDLSVAMEKLDSLGIYV